MSIAVWSMIARVSSMLPTSAGAADQHQRDRAAGVGRGHRGPVEVGVAVVRDARADVDAGGGDVGLDDPVEGRWATAGEGGDVAVDVEGAHPVALRVVAGRGHAAAARAGVAVGEHREDAGGDPGVDGVHVPVVADPAAPGVVDDVRPQVGPRVLRRSGRSGATIHSPLSSRAESEQLLVSHPLAAIQRAAGGDADLVAGAVVTDHRPHRVGAVAVVVARLIGRRSADVARGRTSCSCGRSCRWRRCRGNGRRAPDGRTGRRCRCWRRRCLRPARRSPPTRRGR